MLSFIMLSSILLLCYLLLRAIFIHCCLSFPLLEQAFRRHYVDFLVSSDADRWTTRRLGSYLRGTFGTLGWLALKVVPNFNLSQN